MNVHSIIRGLAQAMVIMTLIYVIKFKLFKLTPVTYRLGRFDYLSFVCIVPSIVLYTLYMSPARATWEYAIVWTLFFIFMVGLRGNRLLYSEEEQKAVHRFIRSFFQ